MRTGGARRGSVVLAGAVARRPGRAGHAWAFLQYVLGFRRLGWDVLWLDSIDDEPGGRGSGTGRAVDSSARRVGLGAFDDLTDFAGIEGDAALLVGATEPDGGGREPLRGPDRARIVERVRAADLFINVMGYIRDEEILGAARRTLFLDIDPGFGQMWQDLGLARLFHGHDAYATVGLRVGEPDCRIPTLGIDWIRTPPPVVLDAFDLGTDDALEPPTRDRGRARPALGGTARSDSPEPAAAAGGAWTSIVSWRGPFAPIDHGGRRYGLRAHEFRKLLDLPARAGADFRIALDIDPEDEADRERLIAAGWGLVDPRAVAGDLDGYRRFIAGSAGEFMVAKGLYVETRSGWFSDRSTCYLAAGRPVVAQDTGWSERIETDRGLLAFDDLDGAAAAIEGVEREPGIHRRAAREVARSVFDARHVLPRLVERAMSSDHPAADRVAATGGAASR